MNRSILAIWHRTREYLRETLCEYLSTILSSFPAFRWSFFGLISNFFSLFSLFFSLFFWRDNGQYLRGRVGSVRQDGTDQNREPENRGHSATASIAPRIYGTSVAMRHTDTRSRRFIPPVESGTICVREIIPRGPGFVKFF